MVCRDPLLFLTDAPYREPCGEVFGLGKQRGEDVAGGIRWLSTSLVVDLDDRSIVQKFKLMLIWPIHARAKAGARSPTPPAPASIAVGGRALSGVPIANG